MEKSVKYRTLGNSNIEAGDSGGLYTKLFTEMTKGR